MPKLAMIAGVRIAIWPNDHEPSHVHCYYNSQECRLAITNSELIDGDLERAKLIAVKLWLDTNRNQIAFAWRENYVWQRFQRKNRMKRYSIVEATVSEYPLIYLKFDDGLEGDYDLSAYIAKGPMFEPLKNVEFFQHVKIGESGRWLQ